MSRASSPSSPTIAPHSEPKEPPKDAAAAPNYETVFTNAKAGMESADLDKVKRVVYEMSKDSAHYQNEQRKMKQTQERIDRMKATAAALSPEEIASKAAAVDARVAELEATRDLTRTWLHVDMDAFFAAVEELDNPNIKGRPFAVGGMGMISTASYAARTFGVRSAMPGFIAVKLCPELIFVPPNFEKYRAASEITRKVFARFDPKFEAGSLDEAYLDVTDVCESRGVKGDVIAAEIRAAVEKETQGLTCSCGIAPNRTLAKICSDKNKPNGQYLLESTSKSVAEFVSKLPVRKIPGVGRVTEHVLKAFNVEFCCDILPHRGLLAAMFSPVSMEFFLQCALGLGETRHAERSIEGGLGRKGISTERTFRTLSSQADLEAKCGELAVHLAEDMAEEGLRWKTLTLKLKLTTFELRTRAVTLDRYISSSDDILTAALKLLRAELPVEIRLMGLRMSQFYEEARREPGQPSLEDLFKRKERQRQQKGEVEKKLQITNKDELLHQPGASEAAPQDTINLRYDGSTRDYQDSIDEIIHTSQILSPGDELELTLRDWQSAPSASTSPIQRDNPPTMCGISLHMPSTTLDDIVRKTRESDDLPVGRTPHLNAGLHESGPTAIATAATIAATWACEACTFENPKGQLICEMCGTTKGGMRLADDAIGGGRKKGKGKKRNQGAAAGGNGNSAGGSSISSYFAPQSGNKRSREAQ